MASERNPLNLNEGSNEKTTEKNVAGIGKKEIEEQGSKTEIKDAHASGMGAMERSEESKFERGNDERSGATDAVY